MALPYDDKKWILETLVPRQALENWRYDQGGKKPQAWGLVQAAARPVTSPTVNVPVVTQETLEAALRNVLAGMLGQAGSGN